jgi:hypothetical protein
MFYSLYKASYDININFGAITEETGRLEGYYFDAISGNYYCP